MPIWSLYALSQHRLQRLNDLLVSGHSPCDMRGKHNTRPHVIAPEVAIKICLKADTIESCACTCLKGCDICHHMVALTFYGHYNVSITDKACSWLKKKGKEASVTAETCFASSSKSASVCYPFVAVNELFKHEFDVIANMIMYTFGIFIGLAKTIMIILNRVKIGKMLDKLEKAPFVLNRKRGGKREEELIKKCLWITKAQKSENVSSKKIQDNKKIRTSSIKWKYLKKTLEKTVQYHLDILKMAGEIEELCNKLLLFVFISTLGMLCFIIYRASLLSLGDTQLLRNIFEGLSISLQVLIICYWGQQVTNESELVANAVFDSNFEGTDLRFQKALTLTMIRCQKPIHISAGKFADVGLPTFAWIMRTSYSAFMVVYNKNAKVN
ncbi:hypothetical protein RN001_007964 [Aquatica leii]|uniref:Odorant receptor n=1 Tax=Aquatica leii TaxID=1421715 RepID=A0AAN7PA70_9COLE|nr:hypothetical protein RN001_007964 [Aquatica leii]